MFIIYDTFTLKSGYAMLTYLHRTCMHARTHTNARNTHTLALVHANREGVIRARKLTRAHIQHADKALEAAARDQVEVAAKGAHQTPGAREDRLRLLPEQ
jgi:L-aminopeptidase/D-esterase-like protein